MLEQLERDHPEVRFVTLDIDENPRCAARYDVLSIPTVILFEGGERGRGGRRLAALALRAGLGRLARASYDLKWSQPASSYGSPRRVSATPSPSSTRPITGKPSGSGVAASSS